MSHEYDVKDVALIGIYANALDPPTRMEEMMFGWYSTAVPRACVKAPPERSLSANL